MVPTRIERDGSRPEGARMAAIPARDAQRRLAHGPRPGKNARMAVASPRNSMALPERIHHRSPR